MPGTVVQSTDISDCNSYTFTSSSISTSSFLKWRMLGMDHPQECKSRGSTVETPATILGMQTTPTAKIQVYICWLAHILLY